MKRTTSIRTMLVVSLVLAGFNTVGSVRGRQGGQQPRPPLLEPEARPLGNLHDRAKQNGGRLVLIVKPNRAGSGNLRELGVRSDAVVIGRTVTQRSQLAADGAFITTNSRVLVQEVLKGTVATGSVILVRLPGGAHRFLDGTFAYLHASNYRAAQKGGTHVFFLRKTEKDEQYDLTGETEGQFELDFQTRQVWPGEKGPNAPLATKYTGKLIADFLSDLHKAVDRKK